MALYTYKTADGDVTVEVEEVWHKLLTESDDALERQDRSHIRPDHKYAPGTPISLDEQDAFDDWLVFSTMTCYRAVELKVDLELALKTLTPLQRRYFIMNRLQGYSYAAIAGIEGKARMSICDVVLAAEKKIKIFFR